MQILSYLAVLSVAPSPAAVVLEASGDAAVNAAAAGIDAAAAAPRLAATAVL